MSRILKRPMFRKGGSTNEGIMTGLVDRKGYSNGSVNKEAIRSDISNIKDLFTEFAPQPRDTSLSEMLIGGGLNLVSGAGAGEGLMANLARSYKGPSETFFERQRAREAYDSKMGSAAAQMAIGRALSPSKESVLATEKKARFLLPADATAEDIRNKTAEIIESEMTGKTYGPEANLERAINSYRNQYGDGSKAYNHASFDVKVAPALREAGKNPRSNIKFKDGKYKTTGKSPGVYIDVENGKVIEFDGNVAIELPKYSAMLK